MTDPSDLIRIGHVLGPQGLTGAMRLFVIGEPEQLMGLARVQLEGLGWRRVGAVTHHGPGLLLELVGVGSREAAERLTGRAVFAHEAELPALPEGEYYYHALRGLPVLSLSGEELGEVQEVQDGGFQDLLVVARAGRHALVPLQAPYVEVRPGEAVVLDAPPGLLDDLDDDPEGA